MTAWRAVACVVLVSSTACWARNPEEATALLSQTLSQASDANLDLLSRRAGSPNAAPENADTVQSFKKLWDAGVVQLAKDAEKISVCSSNPRHARNLGFGNLCTETGANVNDLFISQQVVFVGKQTNSIQIASAEALARQQGSIPCQANAMPVTMLSAIDHNSSAPEGEGNVKADSVAVCTVVHNEAFGMAEWIQWHRLIGVHHFYIYNDASTDNLKETLQPFVAAGVVTLQNAILSQTNEFGPQQMSFTNCMAEHGNDHQWIGFFDADELVVPHQDICIGQFLESYDKFDGIHVNWLEYKHSGQTTITMQQETQNTNFEQTKFSSGEPSVYTKVFCRTAAHMEAGATSSTSPHTCPLLETVNEHGVKQPNFEGLAPEVTTSKIHVSHFNVGSLEYYVLKRIRGRGFGAAADLPAWDLHACVEHWGTLKQADATTSGDWALLLQAKNTKLKELLTEVFSTRSHH